jgi:hypothetical protein
MATISLSSQGSWANAVAAAAAGDQVNTIVIDAAINMTSAFTYSNSKELRVIGGTYPVMMSAPASSAPFRFSNSDRVVFDGVTFYGDSGSTYDGLEAVLFCSDVRELTFRDCSFIGLACNSTLSNIVRVYNSRLTMYNCRFAACFTPNSGALGIQTPTGYTIIEGCFWNDLHALSFPLKASNGHSWIHVFDGIDYPYAGSVMGAGGAVTRINIRNCGFDEAAIGAILIDAELSGTKRYPEVTIEGVSKWERGSLSPYLLRARHVDRLNLRDIKIFSNASSPSIDCYDCRSIYAEHLVYANGSITIPTLAADTTNQSLTYKTKKGKTFTCSPSAGAVSLAWEAA